MILFSVAAVGCSRAAPRRAPTGSQGVVASEDASALYVATGIDDRVTRVDVETRVATQVEVLGEPTRVARIDDRVFVTLRTERAVLEMTDTGQTLLPGRTVAVGAEPVGIVASEDRRLYVAASLSGQVLEIDGDSLETRRVWNLPGEPRWLALNPARSTLYVAGALDAALFAIDLDTGVSTQIRTPQAFGDFTGGPLSARITGDIAVSHDGEFMALPMMFLDTTAPITETETSTPTDTATGADGYSDVINPVVAFMPLVDGRPSVSGTRIIRIAFSFAVLGYASSVAISPDDRRVYASIEGAATLLTLATPELFPDTSDPFTHIEFADVGLAVTGRGPRAVVPVANDEVFVYSFLDREVKHLVLPNPPPFISGDPAIRYGASIQVAPSNLTAEVERGRRLFYAADNLVMSRLGGGVSCASCHFEGRTDGLTWTFDRGPRQTISLAGMVSLREPVRRDGDRATVADDALLTATGLMGGTGLTLEQAQEIAAFIDYVRSVDTPDKGIDNEQVSWGREIFYRPEVACGACHAGPIMSDKQRYVTFSVDVLKTPSLLGVAATPPYLHDGSAPTLRAVLERARTGLMGNTGALTDAEMDALVAYLRTL